MPEAKTSSSKFKKKINLENYVSAGQGDRHTLHQFFSGTFNYEAFYYLTVLEGIIRPTEHVKPRTRSGQEQMVGSKAVSGNE